MSVTGEEAVITITMKGLRNADQAVAQVATFVHRSLYQVHGTQEFEVIIEAPDQAFRKVISHERG